MSKYYYPEKVKKIGKKIPAYKDVDPNTSHIVAIIHNYFYLMAPDVTRKEKYDSFMANERNYNYIDLYEVASKDLLGIAVDVQDSNW